MGVLANPDLGFDFSRVFCVVPTWDSIFIHEFGIGYRTVSLFGAIDKILLSRTRVQMAFVQGKVGKLSRRESYCRCKQSKCCSRERCHPKTTLWVKKYNKVKDKKGAKYKTRVRLF